MYSKYFDSSHNDGVCVLLLLLLLLRGAEVVTEGAGVMTVLVVVQAGAFGASGSDVRKSLARLCFFSLAFSRPARQNSSNFEFMSSSDLLAAPTDD